MGRRHRSSIGLALSAAVATGGCLVDFPLPTEVAQTSATSTGTADTSGDPSVSTAVGSSAFEDVGEPEVLEPWVRVAAIASRTADESLPDAEEAARFHLLVATADQSGTWAGARSDSWSNLRALNPEIRLFIALENPGVYAPYEEFGDGWDFIVQNHGIGTDDRWTAFGVANPTSYLQWSTQWAMTLEPATWRAYWLDSVDAGLTERLGAEGKASIDGIYVQAMDGYRYPRAGAWEAEVSPGVLEPDHPADYHDGSDYDDAKFQEHFDLLLDDAIDRLAPLEVAVGFSGLHETEEWSALDARAQPIAFAFTSAGLIQQWGGTYNVTHFVTKLEQAAGVRNTGLVHGNQGNAGEIPGEGLAKMDASAATTPGEGTTQITGWEALWFALCGHMTAVDPARDDLYFYFSVWGFDEFHWFDEYDPELLHLGAPRGDAFELDAARMREFDDGWVVLNGTQGDLAAVRVPTGSARVITHDNFRAPDTAPLVEAFDLPLHRGVILLREGATLGRG